MAVNVPILPFGNIIYTDFIDNLNENPSHKFSFDELNNFIYVSNSDSRHFINDFSACNTFQEPQCSYYYCDHDNQFTSCGSLNILSFNINSVPLHLNKLFDQWLSHFDTKFHIVGLCETRLNYSVCSLYNFVDYNTYFRNRSTSGGCLAVHLHKPYTAKLLN